MATGWTVVAMGLLLGSDASSRDKKLGYNNWRAQKVKWQTSKGKSVLETEVFSIPSFFRQISHHLLRENRPNKLGNQVVTGMVAQPAWAQKSFHGSGVSIFGRIELDRSWVELEVLTPPKQEKTSPFWAMSHFGNSWRISESGGTRRSVPVF